MRVGASNFCNERLIDVREARGLTQAALGEMIGKNSSTVSRWEKCDNFPEPDALERLSQVLNVPVAFFQQKPMESSNTPLFFRSMASTTQSLRKVTRAKLRWGQELSFKLQSWLEFPEVKLPRLNATNCMEISDLDIEKVASECRELWGVGLGPISDLLLAMENAGIIVIKLEVGSSSMDGLSNWSPLDNRPYVLIAKDKETCVRSRFDAAHELGHIVLHSNLKDSTLLNTASFKEIERQAFYFAGALLMPAESFGVEVDYPSLSNFMALKGRWKTSIAAMIMRCKALGIVTEEYSTQLWKYYSSKGWRKSEPFDDRLECETPKLLSRSVNLLVESKILSKEQIKQQFLLSDSDIESICGLATKYLSGENAEIINFPKLKDEKSKSQFNDNVTPFKS